MSSAPDAFNSLAAVLLILGLGGCVVVWIARRTNTVASCVTSLMAHLVISAYLLYNLGIGALGPDAGAYQRLAERVAESLSGQATNVAFTEGKEGWSYLLGLLYYLFGPAPEVGLATVALFMAVVPAIAASTTRRLGWPHAAQTAAWLSVLTPALLIWPSSILREGPAVFLLSLMALAMAMFVQGKAGRGGLLLLAAGLGMMWIRPQSGVAAVIGVACGAVVIAFSRHRSVMNAVTFLGPVVLALPFGLIRGRTYDLSAIGQLRENLAFGATTSTGATGAGWDSWDGALRSVMGDLPSAAFGPFPWQLGSQPWQLIVDGLAMAALVALVVMAIRWHPDRIIVVAMALPGFVILLTVAATLGNYGFAVRQRSQIVPFLLSIAALGWVTWRQRRRDRHRPAVPDRAHV